jgi:hypothetical protein
MKAIATAITTTLASMFIMGSAHAQLADLLDGGDKIKNQSHVDIKGRSTVANKAEGANSVAEMKMGGLTLNGDNVNVKIKNQAHVDIKGRATVVNEARNGGRAVMEIGQATINAR